MSDRDDILSGAVENGQRVTFLYSGSRPAGLPDSGVVATVQDTYLTTADNDVVPLELLYGVSYPTTVVEEWGGDPEPDPDPDPEPDPEPEPK